MGAKPFAGCPDCGAPLISTMDFRGAEFYCLECGRKCGYFSPRPIEATPEVEGRHAALQTEWDEHAAGRLLLHGGWLHNCELCNPRREPHREHATDEEWREHEVALEWLKQRAEPTRG